MEDNAFDMHSLPKCDNLFELGREIGSGASSNVHEATEKRSGRKLAVKIIKITPGNEELVREECRILTHLPKHENIVDVYGIYIKKEKNFDELWIVMEFPYNAKYPSKPLLEMEIFISGIMEPLCLGTASDFVREMEQNGKKVNDFHLSYIFKGLIQGIIHLHENRVIHRDIRGSNILITRDGEIRLTDFGISKVMKTPSDTANITIGSPSWMAPEMISPSRGYDNKVDVWAMGITAMELADGVAPFENMHPARALFQITRNPPPSLIHPSSRSQILNDFINECLEKTPENRPVIQEFMEHPLFQQNDSTIDVVADIINIMQKYSTKNNSPFRNKTYPEVLIRDGYMKVENEKEEKILHGDLAMLKDPTEDAILNELEERLKKNHFHTFIGDILLVLRPNESGDIYNEKYHEKYRLKARSDNAPHVYSVADSAYQDMLHHEEPQQILITGEAASGKTTSMLHILDHLLFLGQGNKCGANVAKSVNVIHALGNAATFHNSNSTRHILQTQVSFTATGKVSGAIFWIYQLEKNRVTMADKNLRNFHIFYQFFHGLQNENKLGKYFLEGEKNYEFLRNNTVAEKTGVTPKKYAEEFVRFEENLKDLGFEHEQLKSIRRILAAILIIGEIEFGTDGDGNAKLTTQNEADAVADLLGLDQKKFSWALLKYCVIMKGEAVMRYHTEKEAAEAKSVLARGLYFRLIDYIINYINEKMSIPRAIYGDKHTVNILDLFGFECSNTNAIDQLIINCMNEQLQYYYSQKIFYFEMKNAEEEEIPIPPLHFRDNKIVIDQLLSKPYGLMHLIDESTKSGDLKFLLENLQQLNNSHIVLVKDTDFSIAHYTGKITYNASDVLDRNRDFLPPEMIDTMRRSSDDSVRQLFTGLLTTTGNLTMHSGSDKMDNREGRWNTRFSSANKKFRGRKFNTSSKGQYSQSRQMRTAVTTFRATCMEILRSLTSNENNIHFVKCVRTNLNNTPLDFNKDIIRHQIRAFGALETVLARQRGYSYRLTFSDFIRRYQFLAFDFNEPIEETKENCRLLLIRLKMEGWIIGKTKIFLKYYDREYLSRLYGLNVRKIVKVQSMMRAFLARRHLRAKIKRFQENMGRTDLEESTNSPTRDNRDHQKNEDENLPLQLMKDLDRKVIDFIRPWFLKWKTQSMYQVLLLHRSTLERSFVYFCQQVHVYNQNDRCIMELLNEEVPLKEIDVAPGCMALIPAKKISVHKTPFRLSDLTLFDSAHLCGSVNKERKQKLMEEDEEWDAPFKYIFKNQTSTQNNCSAHDKECQTDSRLVAEHTSVKNNIEESVNSSDQVQKIPNHKSDWTDSKNEVISKAANSYLKNSTKPGNYIGTGPRRNVHMEENPIDTSQVDDIQSRNATGLIRTSEEPLKYKSPVREMEEKFRKKQKSSSDDDDDDDCPPYNFRALLKKTNYTEFGYRNKVDPINNKYDFTLKKKLKRVEELKNERQTTCSELAPGLIIEGEIADL